MMKAKSWLVLAGLIFATSSTYAEVIENYTWKAYPGKGTEMLASFVEAKAIHEDMGASVSISMHGTGSTNQFMDYIMRWDNLEDWAKSLDMVRSPKGAARWQKFMGKYEEPLGEMVSSTGGGNADLSKTTDDFDGSYVYAVFVWEPKEGKQAEFLQSALEAEKLHESLGARVEVYLEQFGTPGRLHYVMMYEDYASWAQSTMQMGQSKEWAEMQAANAAANVGTLVSSMRGQTLVAQ
ncbi:MAG: hypothetical protein ACJ0Q8_07830 [Candidatus Azotimanducaceae bacterium]